VTANRVDAGVWVLIFGGRGVEGGKEGRR